MAGCGFGSAPPTQGTASIATVSNSLALSLTHFLLPLHPRLNLRQAAEQHYQLLPPSSSISRRRLRIPQTFSKTPSSPPATSPSPPKPFQGTPRIHQFLVSIRLRRFRFDDLIPESNSICQWILCFVKALRKRDFIGQRKSKSELNPIRLSLPTLIRKKSIDRIFSSSSIQLLLQQLRKTRSLEKEKTEGSLELSSQKHNKGTMSREAYQIPDLNSFGTVNGGIGITGTEGPAVSYICGECNSRVSLRRGDQIRCKECGHRVLYKERTKR